MSSIRNGSPGCAAYSFGDFVVQVNAGVLRRNGKRVRVQALPLQMLLVLLEKPGQLVTREELQSRLWGDGTFVEVEHGLHVVAAKLRDALGDHATHPLLIKTISGRGYQFIGNATPHLDAADGSSGESVRHPESITHNAIFAESQRPVPKWHVWATVLGALLLITAIFISARIYTEEKTNSALIGDGDRVVVGGFTNNTGNPDFDGMLSSAFRLKLEESPYLSFIPDSRYRRVVKNPDLASVVDEFHACAAVSGQVLLTGQILSQAKGYQLLLSAWRCADGRLLARQGALATSQSDILSALDLATNQMRRRLGESGSSLRRFNAPSLQATTSSLAALKAFTLGEEKRLQGLKTDSIASYKLAIDIDPQFALAYARLGIAYMSLGELSLSREYYQKAFDLRNRTTDRERLYIITHYYAYNTGEIQSSIKDYELWRTLYPYDLVPTNNLALEYLTIGQPEKSLDLARTAVRLDPKDNLPYGTLALAYLRTGAYHDLAALCNDPVQGKAENLVFHMACYEGAFAQYDEAGMQHQLQWAKGSPEESELLDDAAWVAMYRGKISEARRIFSTAKQSALRNNFVELAAEIELDEATLDTDVSLMKEAREEALDALKLAPSSPFAQASAALVLGRAGDMSRAQVEAKKAADQAPLDTILNSAVLASARAAIQLQKHESRAAIQSLEETRPFDFCESMSLAPAYYRGLAYLQGNHPQRAAKEFQRVIDHRVLVPYSPYIVLSQLELGRALQLSGNIPGAARAYHVAEAAWKDADPDFPPLQQLHAYQHTLPMR